MISILRIMLLAWNMIRKIYKFAVSYQTKQFRFQF